MALRIVIETIPHKSQRYKTVGDWRYAPDGTIHIAVSDMGDWRKEACVAVHELVEVLMCRYAGVSQSEVDKFDKDFEAKRPEGSTDEPGDSPLAPYAKQHCVATGVERILAAMLGLSWDIYDKVVNALAL